MHVNQNHKCTLFDKIAVYNRVNTIIRGQVTRGSYINDKGIRVCINAFRIGLTSLLQ